MRIMDTRERPYFYLSKIDRMKQIMKKFLLLMILIIVGIAAGGIFYLTKKSETPKPQVLGAQSKNNQPNQITNNQLPITNYEVPILMYHYIRDFDDPNDKIGTNLSVSPQKLEEQLKWLKENGYQSVSLSDLVNKSFDSFDSTQDKSAQDQNDKFVILTFDDGYKDAYTSAYPLLKKYEFTATFYIITDYVEKNNPNYMSWDNIKELKKAGMDIGSHTLTHPDLEKSDDSRVDKEIRESKKNLESTIGDTISDFCYPSGKYDARTIEALKKYGYKTATTVKNGVADQNSNLFELPRIRITNETNLGKILND